jgi:hypothetical protein
MPVLLFSSITERAEAEERADFHVHLGRVVEGAHDLLEEELAVAQSELTLARVSRLQKG